MRQFAIPLLLLAEPAFASARLTGGAAPEIPWLRLVLSFAACILVAVGAVLALRKLQGRRPAGILAFLSQDGSAAAARSLHVLERRRIGVNAELLLIQCDDQRLLLAATPRGVEVLTRQASRTEPNEGAPS